MNPLHYGLTPKMKPVSPKRSALIAALDIGTSKIVCLIARLTPHAPQEVLRRRSHAVEVIGFSHTGARGMKAGNVVDLVEAEEAVRHAVDLAERSARRQIESAIVSVSAGRLASELFAASVDVTGPAVSDSDIARVLAAGRPALGAPGPGGAAFAADRVRARRCARHPRPARHAGAPISGWTCTSRPPTGRRRAT